MYTQQYGFVDRFIHIFIYIHFCFDLFKKILVLNELMDSLATKRCLLFILKHIAEDVISNWRQFARNVTYIKAWNMHKINQQTAKKWKIQKKKCKKLFKKRWKLMNLMHTHGKHKTCITCSHASIAIFIYNKIRCSFDITFN